MKKKNLSDNEKNKCEDSIIVIEGKCNQYCIQIQNNSDYDLNLKTCFGVNQIRKNIIKNSKTILSEVTVDGEVFDLSFEDIYNFNVLTNQNDKVKDNADIDKMTQLEVEIFYGKIKNKGSKKDLNLYSGINKINEKYSKDKGVYSVLKKKNISIFDYNMDFEFYGFVKKFNFKFMNKLNYDRFIRQKDNDVNDKNIVLNVVKEGDIEYLVL
jgi:hypothetical protein